MAVSTVIAWPAMSSNTPPILRASVANARLRLFNQLPAEWSALCEAERRLARACERDELVTITEYEEGRRAVELTPAGRAWLDAGGAIGTRAAKQAHAAATPAPAGPPAPSDATIEAFLAAVGDVLSDIRVREPDLPALVPLLAPGRDRWGHFAALRWSRGGESLHELMLAGELLALTAPAVMETLLHEAAHALAHARGIRDTSRQGRYHNEKFSVLAGSLGLTCVHDPRLGWSSTDLTHAGAERWAVQIDKLSAALARLGGLHRRVEIEGREEKETARRVRLACACEPARLLRVMESWIEVGPVYCGVCGAKFSALGG